MSNTIIMTDAQLRMFARQCVLTDRKLREGGRSIITAEAELITTKDTESKLGCSSRTLGRLAECGEIKRVRVGGSWKYDRESVEDYIKRNHACAG